jgi:hypothetical protein
MRRLSIFVGLMLFLAGLMIVAPLALARFHNATARAEIKDVFLQPIGDHQAQVHVLLEYAVNEHGDHVSYTSFGENLADDRLRGIEDPVLPMAEAKSYAHRLLGDDPHFRSTCLVYFAPSDPDVARMISGLSGGPSHAYEFGLAMLACGLMCMMLARRSTRSD